MGGAAGFIGGIGNFLQAAKPILDVVGQFVPALQGVSKAFSAFGQVSDAFRAMSTKTDNANQNANDQGDKTKDVLNTVNNAANTVKAAGDAFNAFKGLTSAFAK